MKSRKFRNRLLAILGCIVILTDNVMAYAEQIRSDSSEIVEMDAEQEGNVSEKKEIAEEEPSSEEETELEENEDAGEEPSSEEETELEESEDAEEEPSDVEESEPVEDENEEDTAEMTREPKDWSADPMFSFTYVNLAPSEDAGVYELNMDLEFCDSAGEKASLVEGDRAVLELPKEWFWIEDTEDGNSLPLFYSEKEEEEILLSEAMAQYTVSDQCAEIIFNEHAEKIGEISDIVGRLTLRVRLPRKVLKETEQTVVWNVQSYNDGTVNQAEVMLPAREGKDWTEETEDFWTEITEPEEEGSVPKLQFGFLRENPECPVMPGDTAEISLKDSGYEGEISKNRVEVRGWKMDDRNRMIETDLVIADYIYDKETQKIYLTFAEGIEDLEDIVSYRGMIALEQPEEIWAEEKPLMLFAAPVQPLDAGVGEVYWTAPVTQDIYWQDNNAGIRPGNDEYKTYFLESGKLQYSYVVNGETYTVLVDAKAVLTEDQITVSDEGGTGHYIMKVDSGVLPGTASVAVDGEEKDVEITGWSFVHPDVDNYYFLDVPDEETMRRYTTSEVGLGWYYLKEFNYTLTVTLRRGDTHPIHGMREAILEDFAFHYRRNGADSDFQSVTLADMLKQSPDAVTIEVTQTGAGDGEINELVILINGIPQYRIDGTERQYFLQQTEGHEHLIPQPEEGEDGLDDGDYFQITYDNTNSPNYGTVTDKGYSGGNLILTLTGDQEYSATKNWMDNERTEERPAVEFTLWRYSKRDGADYTQASPVKNEEGHVLSLSVPEGYTESTYEIDFCKSICEDSESDVLLAADEKLPKYDSEGYEYVYFVKETVGSGGSEYKKVFGEINTEDGTDFTVEDTLPYDGDRKETDTGIYNGGTLNNSLTGTVQAEFEKNWKAAAYQDEFDGVKVEFTLQARHKVPEGNAGDEWYDVTDADGKAIIREVTGFGEEKMSDSYDVSVGKYDSMGHELEYQWVETGVYQGADSTDNLLGEEDKDGVRTFVLEQRGKKVTYRSETEEVEQPDGTYKTVIVNRIDDTVNLNVKKLWYEGGEEVRDPEKTSPVELVLWRQTYDGDNTKLGIFTVDGTVDSDGTKILIDGETAMARETSSWHIEFRGLPEFDSDGHEYDYFVLEKTGNYRTRYEQGVDVDGNYYEMIFNEIGEGEEQYVNVRKRWIDDGDTQHRGEVTLTLYERQGEKQFDEIKAVVLNSGAFWWKQVSVSTDIVLENILVLETEVAHTGDPEDYTEIPYTPEEMEAIWQALKSGKDSDEPIYYKTDEHWYQVTNSIKSLDNVEFYTVTNQRLGSVNLDATKTWLDGDGTAREELRAALEEKDIKAYLKLTCEVGGAVDYAAGTVTVNNRVVQIKDKDGTPAGAYQEIDMTTSDPQTVYFYGLPKYDGKGGVVHYSVEEVYAVETVSDGVTHYTETTLASEGISTDFVVSYEIGDYQVTHTDDKQEFKVVNRLTGVKTISYKKQWLDAYRADRNERPDIYLSIYRQVHTSENTTALEPVYQDHIWEKVDNDDQNYWSVSFSALPKYDDLGYEIIYYAQEQMHVNGESFDYLPVYYKYDTDGGGASAADSLPAIGSETGYYEGEAEDGRLADYDGIWLLKEGGTFVNRLEKTLTIEGKKIWGNIPGGYNMAMLPSIQFSVYRSLESGDGTSEDEKEPFAWITIKDWQKHYVDSEYKFLLEYSGENTNEKVNGRLTAEGTEGAQRLPLYDEAGRRYEYTIGETMTLKDGTPADQVYQTSADTFRVKNTYSSAKGSLTVQNHLPAPEENEEYPTITFVLTRYYQYEDDSSSGTLDNSFRKEGQISYSDFKEGQGTGTYTFTDLEIYDPSGRTFKYEVEEISVDGYRLAWAEAGDYSPEQKLENDTQPYGEVDLNVSRVGNLTAGVDPDGIPDATYGNEIAPERIMIEGTKNWNDAEDAWGFRPGVDEIGNAITFEVTRYAEPQPGQENGTGTKANRLTVDPSKYEIKWSEAGDNQYKFEITGKGGELERYDPNGMPWKYYVKEVVVPEEDGGTGLPGYADPEKQESECIGTDDSVELKDGKEVYQAQKQTAEVTNSRSETAARIEKKWKISKDPSGDAGKITDETLLAGIADMTEDYLGYLVEVEFTLQARLAEKYGSFGEAEDFDADESQDWQDTDDLFVTTLGQGKDNYANAFDKARNTRPQSSYIKSSETDKYVVVLKGYMLNDDSWKASFQYLPEYVRDRSSTDGSYYKLEYRFVESRIIYKDKDGNPIGEQDIERPDDSSDRDNVMSPESSNDELFGIVGVYNPNNNPKRSTWANILPVTTLTIRKVWKDTNNAYGTRKLLDGKWQAEFVIQRKAEGDTLWEDVYSYDAYGTAARKTVTLTGEDEREHNASVDVTGLPVFGVRVNAAGELERVKYTYRARELNTDEDKTVIALDDSDGKGEHVYNGSGSGGLYDVEYTDKNADDGTYSTETTNSFTPTVRYAAKTWSGIPVEYEVDWHYPVTLELKYVGTDDELHSFNKPAQVILDGDKDPSVNTKPDDLNVPYGEYDAWKAVWKGVPDYMPDSKLDKQGNTIYKVVELDGGFYQTEAEGKSGASEADAFAFTNIPTRLKISKTVNTGAAPISEINAEQWEFKFKLTSDRGIAGRYKAIVTDSDAPSSRTTAEVTIGEEFTLKHGQTIEIYGLPIHDAGGNRIKYTVEEVEEFAFDNRKFDPPFSPAVSVDGAGEKAGNTGSSELPETDPEEGKETLLAFQNTLEGAIHLVKKDEKGNTLEGVGFTITYCETEDGTYQAIDNTVCSDQTLVDAGGVRKSDADGKVDFTGLKLGYYYQIVETELLPGTNGLAMPIIESLPKLLDASAVSASGIRPVGSVTVDGEEKNIYVELTYMVTNNSFTMPVTSGSGFFWPGMAGLALAGIGCGYWIISERKKKRYGKEKK